MRISYTYVLCVSAHTLTFPVCLSYHSPLRYRSGRASWRVLVAAGRSPGVSGGRGHRPPLFTFQARPAPSPRLVTWAPSGPGSEEAAMAESRQLQAQASPQRLPGHRGPACGLIRAPAWRPSSWCPPRPPRPPLLKGEAASFEMESSGPADGRPGCPAPACLRGLGNEGSDAERLPLCLFYFVKMGDP